MTYYHAATAVYFAVGNPFTLNDVQYPSNWLELATHQEIADLGLEPVVTIGAPKDGSLFDNREELVGAVKRIITTPKDPALIAADNAVAVAVKINAVKALRETAVNRVNGIAAREARAGNATILAIGDAVVVALIAMTKELPTDPSLIDAVVVQRYAAIVAPLQQSAPELLSAFAGMDL